MLKEFHDMLKIVIKTKRIIMNIVIYPVIKWWQFSVLTGTFSRYVIYLDFMINSNQSFYFIINVKSLNLSVLKWWQIYATIVKTFRIQRYLVPCFA